MARSAGRGFGCGTVVGRLGRSAASRSEFMKDEKKEFLENISGVSLGSDAFFPFSDNIERAAKSGVKFIAEPGGSIRDEEVIKKCDELGITMVFTGSRLFHH